MARILVADDDAALRSIVVRALTRAGYEVHEVASGREALAVALAGGIDLVITDVYMPDMDGIEFITRLSQDPGAPKIIAVSGGGHASTEGVLEIATRLGVTRTLAKPFSPAELVAAVRSELRRDPPSA